MKRYFITYTRSEFFSASQRFAQLTISMCLLLCQQFVKTASILFSLGMFLQKSLLPPCFLKSLFSEALKLMLQYFFNNMPTQGRQLPDFNRPLLLEVETDNFYNVQSRKEYYYLELVNSVRKVGVIHNCSSVDGCEFSFTKRIVRHSTNTLNGGRFFILTRAMAYPPRRS